MINAEDIGKRIRILRKRKNVSQERMALELGMYQADISNLERAVSGSGIADLFKLDLIAEYFNIPLVELLGGSDLTCSSDASGTSMAKSFSMIDYTIRNAVFDSAADTLASAVTLEAPDGNVSFITFVERDEKPCFYRSGTDLWEGLLEKAAEPAGLKSLRPYCFLSGEDYCDIFCTASDEWISIYRLLVFIAVEDADKAADLIDRVKGRKISDIVIPVSSVEPEELFHGDYSDLSAIYRYRLMVETSLKNPSVYSDIDNTYKREKAILEKLKAACVSEEAYKVWKKDLIDAKVDDVMKSQKIVVCSYMFAGIGSYREMMPEEMVESFRCWIDHNGSAFFCGVKPATKREIRTYVSAHIADEILGIPSPMK